MISVYLLALLLVPLHGGGLDELGCHADKKKNEYHCHRGALAGKTFKTKGEALAALVKAEKKEEKKETEPGAKKPPAAKKQS